jgi:YD repeat-containing protein
MNKIKHFKLVLMLLIFVISIIPVNAERSYAPYMDNPQVATSPGNSEVSGSANTDLFTGAATYTYPIKVPPGVNGLQPFISLSYNHQGTNSFPSEIGVAWSLSKNYVERHTSYSREDTTDDYFILHFNGMTSDLVYDDNEDDYHTEVESFYKIKKKNLANNQQGEYWELITKDGTKYRFGYNHNSELISNQEDYVSKWNLDQVLDKHGNVISYSYWEVLGDAHLQEISYGDNVITFDYNGAPVMGGNSYANGNTLNGRRLINSIEVRNDRDLVREYSLNYEFIESNYYLSDITEIGSDGRTENPPVNFDYFPIQKGWVEDRSWDLPRSIGPGSVDMGYRFVDLNRDGLVDYLRGYQNHDEDLQNQDESDQEIWFNTGNGFERSEMEVPFVFSKYYRDRMECGFHRGIDRGVRFAELNGDGITDYLIGPHGNYAGSPDRLSKHSYQGTGENFERFDDQFDLPIKFVSSYEEGCNLAYGYDTSARIVDLNGDGLDDLIHASYSSRSYGMLINDGNEWISTEQWEPPEWFTATRAPKRQCSSQPGINQGTHFADINGDGLIDIVVSYLKRYSGGTEGFRDVYLNNGKNFVRDNAWSWQIIGIEEYFVEDEIIGNFDCDSVLGSNQGLRFADVNGDGLPDILKGKSREERKAWINTGTAWRLDNEWIPVFDFVERNPNADIGNRNTAVRLVDVNGDQLVDFVSGNRVWINQAGKSRLLRNVDDSIGGTISFDYEPSTSYDNTGDDNSGDLGFNVWVVSSISRDNGINGVQEIESTSTYGYSSGLFDYEDKEFRGFAEVEETLPNEAVMKHYFYQDDARKGIEYQTELFDEDTLLKKTESTWHVDEQEGYSIISLSEENIYDYFEEENKRTHTSYEYDDYGNPTEINHQGDFAIGNDDWNEEFEYVYNVNEWIVANPKHHTVFNNDETTFSEEWFYYDLQRLDQAPDKGDLTKHKIWLNDNDDIEIEYRYDDFGNVIREIDPNDNVINYEYDDTHTFPVEITNPLNQITIYGYDLGTGNLLSQTDANDFTTSYQYDIFGRKIKEIQPYDTVNFPTVRWEYDFDGTAPEKVKVSSKVSNNNNFEEWFFYDGFGDLIQGKKEADNNQQIVNDYYYDESNKLESVSNNYFRISSEVYSQPNQQVDKTNYEYDKLNRVTLITNPDGTEKEIIHGLWEETVIDENNHEKKFYFDAFNRIRRVDEKVEDETYITTYQYDLNDNVISVLDEQDNEFSYTYDSVGRLTEMDDPDMGEWGYSYDSNANLIKKEDANGNVVMISYDRLNRPMIKEDAMHTTIYTYDEETIGTLSSISNQNMQKTFEYDQRLRPDEETINIGRNDFTTTRIFDSMDRVISETVNGEEITYAYRNQGLSNLNDEVSFEYNGFNLPVNRIYENQLTSEITYDNRQRVEQILTGRRQNLNYQYDAVGNVLEINDRNNNNLLSMEYDEIDRLTYTQSEGNNEFEATYTYDSIGNMLSAIVNDEIFRFTYDGNQVHSPSSVNSPRIVPDCDGYEELIDNECVHIEEDEPIDEPQPDENLPDLIILKFVLQNKDRVLLGEKAIYELVIRNIGSETAREITWVIENLRTGEVLVNSDNFPEFDLEPRQMNVLYPKFVHPCEDIRVIADADKLIDESNEKNNVEIGLLEDGTCRRRLGKGDSKNQRDLFRFP